MISPYVYPGLNNLAMPKLEDLITSICSHYKVDERKIYARTRKEDVMRARQAVMFTMIKLLGMTTTMAGKKLFRDHSTCIHGCERIQGIVTTNEEERKLFVQAISEVSVELAAKFNMDFPMIKMRHTKIDLPRIDKDFGRKVFMGEIRKTA